MQILPRELLYSGLMREITLIFIYIGYTFFFSDQPTGQTLRPIFTRDDSKVKNAKSRKGVPFGLHNLKMRCNPCLGPTNVDFWQKGQNFRPKITYNGHHHQ